MATKYLRSSATGSGDGSNWANAYTTSVVAANALPAGDTLLVANDHNEVSSAADIPIVFTNSTLTSPAIVISVDPANDNYSRGALITTNGNFNISINGYFIMEGVSLNVGVGATTARSIQIVLSTNRSFILRDCMLTVPSVLNSRVTAGTTGCLSIFDNVTINSGNTNSQMVSSGANFIWKNSICFIGTMPASMFNNSTTACVTLDGCDLSALSTIKTSSTGSQSFITIKNCKLSASLAMYTTPANRGESISVINSSDNTGALRREEHTYAGASTLVTNVYRTGGASDAQANYSNKLVSSAGVSRFYPLASLDLAFNIAAADVGVAKTLTAHILTDAGVTLLANEVWLDIDYLADASSLDSSFATSGPVNGRASGAAPVADAAETWTTTGLTTPVKQAVSKGFTPAKAGIVRARVMLAKTGTTMFVDPKMTLA